MKRIYYSLLLLIPGITYSQNCNQTIYPHVPQPGGSNIHIYSDTTINDLNGSNYYICSGVNVVITSSAGCNYQLENNVTLTIHDQDGDNIIAKGNCTITDLSSESIVVTMEASSTFTKPTNSFMGVVFYCPTVVYNYSLVGGSSPCQPLSFKEHSKEEKLKIYPNPVQSHEKLFIGNNIENAAIFDLTGKFIFMFDRPENDFIQLDEIEKGTYFIKIVTKEGNYNSSLLQIK